MADALLKWFEGVEETRSMPWRKSWIDPAEWDGREGELEGVLAKRAYEVWVSEVSELLCVSLSRVGVGYEARGHVVLP